MLRDLFCNFTSFMFLNCVFVTIFSQNKRRGGAIIGFLSRGSPNSANSTPLLPQIQTMSMIHGESSFVSLLTQAFIFFPASYSRPMYFLGILPFIFVLFHLVTVPCGQFPKLMFPSLTLARHKFPFPSY